MLGDSFTFGKGVNSDQTFAALLENDLNESKKSDVVYEVINGGCSSYSPILEYLLLIDKGLAIDPDLVILNYDISDVQDDYKYANISEFDERGKPIRVRPINVQWFYTEPEKRVDATIPWFRNSKFYALIVEQLYRLVGARDMPFYYEKAKIISGDIEYDRDLPMRENAGDWKRYFDHSAKYLTLIRDVLFAKGARFVITAYPYGVLVNGKEWSEGRSIRGFDKKQYSTELFQYLEDYTAEYNIPFVNMLADFLTASDFPLFYSYDGHFTPAGHRVAARSIERLLRQQQLLVPGRETPR